MHFNKFISNKIRLERIVWAHNIQVRTHYMDREF